MTDIQLLTAAIAIIFPLSMLIYSNSRITEAKETLRAEIAGLRAEQHLSFEQLLNEIRSLRDALKIHELEHHGKR
jgi:hypothetical protein